MIKQIKYLIEYLIVKFLFFYFRRFNIDQASDQGAFIAKLIGPRLPINKIARNNIKRAMADKSEQEINEIIISMWDNIGRVAAEFPHIFSLSLEEFNKRIQIEGKENIILNQYGMIFFSGHLANWEVAPRYTASIGLDTALIYRKANNKMVDNLMQKERAKNNIKIIAKGVSAAKRIIEHLKNAKVIAMLVDQKMNDGIAVPFFGIDAMTAPAIARMAIKHHVQIIPSQIIRVNKGNFILKFYPAIEIHKTQNNEQDVYNIMLKINSLLEQWIREYPGQWFWLHNRWPK